MSKSDLFNKRCDQSYAIRAGVASESYLFNQCCSQSCAVTLCTPFGPIQVPAASVWAHSKLTHGRGGCVHMGAHGGN